MELTHTEAAILVSGVAQAIAAIFAYGKLTERVESIRADVQDLKRTINRRRK